MITKNNEKEETQKRGKDHFLIPSLLVQDEHLFIGEEQSHRILALLHI